MSDAPPGLGYRLGRIVRRYPGAAVLTAGLGVLGTLSYCSTRQTQQPVAPTPIIRQAAAAPPSPETARRDREINIVLAGANMLKASMKKPETFKLTQAIMIDGKTICYRYQARNSFNDVTDGAYVVTDTVSTSDVKTFLKHCAGKRGDDYTSVRAVMQ